MLSRSILRGSALRGMRSISTTAVPRISAVALGKQPAIHSATILQLRHFSWGKPVQPVEILQEFHPDLQSAPPVETSSTPAPLDTSLPDAYSSIEHDVPADLATITPADHLADLVALNTNVPLEELLRSPEAASAVAGLRDLPSIGLDHSWYSLPGWTADALVKLHDLTGLPWWITLVVMSVAIRLILFPTVIETQKQAAKMAIFGPRLRELQGEMSKAKAEGDQVRQDATTQELVKYIRNNNIKPLAAIRPVFIQLPILTSMFFGISRLAAAPLPGFIHEGFGWVQDLTLPDGMWVLPVLTLAFQNLAMRSGADGESSGHVKNGFAVASLGIFFFVKTFPAALLIYWTTAASVTCLQAYVLRVPAVRARFNLPARSLVTTPQPTFRQSIGKLREFWRERHAKGVEIAEQRFLKLQETERAKGLKSGTALMVTEKIVKRGMAVEKPKRVGGIVEMVREEGEQKRVGKPRKPVRGVKDI